MTDAEAVNDLKTALTEVCKKLEVLHKRAIRVDFHLAVDAERGTAQIAKFVALQEMKLN